MHGENNVAKHERSACHGGYSRLCGCALEDPGHLGMALHNQKTLMDLLESQRLVRTIFEDYNKCAAEGNTLFKAGVFCAKGHHRSVAIAEVVDMLGSQSGICITSFHTSDVLGSWMFVNCQNAARRKTKWGTRLFLYVCTRCLCLSLLHCT